MADSSLAKAMAIQSEPGESTGAATAGLLRQQDYRILIPQRVELGSRSQNDTIKIAPQKEIVRFKTTTPSSFDVIAVGSGVAAMIEVKAPRAHLQKQQSTSAFTLLSKFDGVILRRNGNRFWARLWENPNDPEKLEAEFDVSELYGSEEKIAQEGTPIVWTIGYATEHGTRKRQSILYVRRVPPVSDEEVVTSGRAVEKKMARIQWKKE
jgi:hypothetical protein